MTPAVERLVRLIMLLPHDQRRPVWQSATEDTSEAMALRWAVGSAARMWPPGAPRTLAEMTLTVFADPSDTTLHLVSQALIGEKVAGTGVGSAWAGRVREAAIDVLAEHDPQEDVLAQSREHWTLRP